MNAATPSRRRTQPCRHAAEICEGSVDAAGDRLRSRGRGDDEPAAATARGDRITFSYAVIAIALAVWLASENELDKDLGLWLLLVPLMLIPAVVVGLFLLSVLVVNLARCRWRHVASILFALSVALLAFYAVNATAPYDRLRLQWNRSRYMSEVAHLPMEAGTRLAAWQIGQTGGAAVVNIAYFMLYDESDEVARSPGDRSEAWRARARSIGPSTPALFDAQFDIGVRALGGHFYLVTEAF